jgi:hypothetical protein
MSKIFVGAIDLMGATGDWRKFLTRAKDAGAFGCRIFICYSWDGPQPISPYKSVGKWVHSTTHQEFIKYRLREWNPAYWKKLWDVLCYMKKLGLEAWLVFEDYCSLKGNKTDKYHNPMYCSEEALPPNTPGGVWGEAMKPYHANLYWRTIFWANATKCPYYVEAMNEIGIVDGTDEQIIKWSGWANNRIVSFGFPRGRVISSPGGSVASAIAGQVGIYSPHQIGTVAGVTALNGVPTTRTLYSSDGFWKGTGPADAKGRRGVGSDVAGPLAKRLNTVGAVGFELFDRGIWRKNNSRGNLDDYNPAVTKVMAGVK